MTVTSALHRRSSSCVSEVISFPALTPAAEYIQTATILFLRSYNDYAR
jgi:hypothetical protein